MKRKSNIFLITITLSLCYSKGNAQQSIGGIVQNFNTIEWYPDSTIKAAYNIKRKKYRGYAIEFDTLGKPEWIGKYKNGVKHGAWNQFNGSTRLYKRDQWDIVFRPGCGSGRIKAKQEFKMRYAKLTED